MQEFVDNFLERISAFTFSNVASFVSTASLTKGFHHLANKSHRVLISVLSLSLLPILGLSVFIDDNHNIRGITRSPNFKHSVIITLALFTWSAHVEVLANGGLVTNATDGLVVWTSIARYTLMDSFSFFSCHVNISEILRLDEILENFSGLPLELLVYEVLNGFSGNSKLLNLRFLGTFDLLLNRREGSVGLPDSKDELHVGVIGN